MSIVDSHELRTPMACIIGLLEILMGDLKLSEHESSVKQVHRCATSLVTLLNSALDIAKVNIPNSALNPGSDCVRCIRDECKVNASP